MTNMSTKSEFYCTLYCDYYCTVLLYDENINYTTSNGTKINLAIKRRKVFPSFLLVRNLVCRKEDRHSQKYLFVSHSTVHAPITKKRQGDIGDGGGIVLRKKNPSQKMLKVSKMLCVFPF